MEIQYNYRTIQCEECDSDLELRRKKNIASVTERVEYKFKTVGWMELSEGRRFLTCVGCGQDVNASYDILMLVNGDEK